MAQKILLIDDEADFLEIFSKKLQAAGYEVSTAMGAIEGINKVKAEHPDLVLLDVDMPGMNGAEALEALKADPETSGTKVVFLTNLGAERNIENRINEQVSHDVGAAGYIKKTDIDSIAEEVKKHLA
jgi:two-component system alkaline phosphatase synthesis response regulator PhoP